MKIKYSKNIDSFVLKANLIKEEAVKSARIASIAIKPGLCINACPICKSKRNRLLKSIYRFSYYECRYCGASYVSNMPSDEDIKKLYNSAYYTRTNKLLLANKKIIGYRVKNIARPKVGYVLKYLTSKNKSWLDIGCGTGEILSVVSSMGWKAQGVEPNKSEREFGIRNFKINVVDSFMYESVISMQVKRFGVVSLFGVLEHFKDPHALIENIAKIQDKKDNLVIEVPHFPSLSAFVQMNFPDKVNRYMHPPLHLFLFSLGTEQRLGLSQCTRGCQTPTGELRRLFRR